MMVVDEKNGRLVTLGLTLLQAILNIPLWAMIPSAPSFSQVEFQLENHQYGFVIGFYDNYNLDNCGSY